jgi:maleate isomerase
VSSLGSLRPDYRAAIGVVTPSGNTVVERVTTAILADIPGVSAHYSRTPVHGGSDAYPDDYDWEGMLGAARLLAHARPDVVVWNGSKGSNVGFDVDRDYCRRVAAETGLPATTSSLALEAVCRARGIRRVAVISPYGAAYQRKLVAGLEREGFSVAAEAHAGLADNLAYASIDDGAIAAMAERVAVARPEAILAWCTNFPAAYLVPALEARLGIPVLDSVALGLWHALVVAGVPTAGASRWGGVFRDA